MQFVALKMELKRIKWVCNKQYKIVIINLNGFYQNLMTFCIKNSNHYYRVNCFYASDSVRLVQVKDQFVEGT